jgi:hypothetical protein
MNRFIIVQLLGKPVNFDISSALRFLKFMSNFISYTLSA